jgi:hypothetical protein
MDTVVEIAGSKQFTLHITAYGRGAYKRTRLTNKGFPRGNLMRSKSVHGFQTGDQVKAVAPKGNKRGTYLARVAVRDTGSFNLQTSTAAVEGINHKHCHLTQIGDGYGYHLVSDFQHFIGKERASPRPERRGLRASTRMKPRKIIGQGEFDSGVTDLATSKKYMEGLGEKSMGRR